VPTYEWQERFWAQFKRLTPEQQAAFLAEIPRFVEFLRSGQISRGMRLKGLKGHPGLFELSWANDGRAVFEYGPVVRAGERHVIWRRIGSHEIFNDP
jgi:hypothetical protein